MEQISTNIFEFFKILELNQQEQEYFEKEYKKLSDKSKIFLDEKIQVLIDTNLQITQEIEQMKLPDSKPNFFILLKEQLLKLELNTLKVFLKKFSPSLYNLTTDKLNNLSEIIFKKIRTVNEILEAKDLEDDTEIQIKPEELELPDIITVSSEEFVKSLDDNNISKNLDKILSKLITPTILEKLNLTTEKLGGGSETKKLIKEKLNNLIELLDFLKSDLYLKIIMLMMDKDIFIKFCQDVLKIDYIKFTSLFFVNLEEKMSFVEFIKNSKPDLEIDKNIMRDSAIIKLYIDKNVKYIFSPTLAYILNEIDLEKVGQNENNSANFVNLFNITTSKFEVLKNIYLKLKKYDNDLNNYYFELINKYSRISTYIKETNKSIERNPRYQNLNSKNNIISFNPYYNIDGKLNGSLTEKLYQIKNDSDTLHEEYYLGPFNGVFLSTDSLSNKSIANEIQDDIITKLITKKEDVCLISYGQGNNDKTSVLIYSTKDKENGIVVELCQLEKFIQEFNKMEISITNIYTYNNSSELDASSSSLEINNKMKETLIYDALHGWIVQDDATKSSKKILGELIMESFNKRKIEPTPDKPDSYRSHGIIFFNLYNKDGSVVKLIICDIASMDYKYDCSNLSEILKLDISYSESHKYGSKNKNMLLDKYLCFDNSVKTTSDELNKEKNDIHQYIKEKNVLINEFNKLLTDKSKKGDLSNVKTFDEKQCIKPSFLYNFPEKLRYWKQHNGNLESENWMDMKNKCIKSLKYVINSQELINIYQRFISNKLNKGDNENFLKIIEDQKNDDREYLGENKIKNNLLKSKTLNDFYENKSNQELIQKSIKDKKATKLLDDTIINIFDLYKNFLSEEIRLKILKHVCKVRNMEGYTINNSIVEMQKSIKNLIFKSLKLENKHLPLFYDKMYYPYCRNINISDNIFQEFNNIPDNQETNSIIIQLLKENKVNLDKLNFSIFTFINTSDDFNNPPNPPYINTSLLIYSLEVKYNLDNLKKELNLIIKRMNSYNFYKNNSEFNNFLLKYQQKETPSEDDIISFGKELLDIINKNNKLTLIGSIESTDILQKVIMKSICTKNILSDKNLDRYSNIKLPTLRSNGLYKRKYKITYY